MRQPGQDKQSSSPIACNSIAYSPILRISPNRLITFAELNRSILQTIVLMKKILWILLVLFALIVGLYPAIYFLIDRNFGLLNSKSNEVLANTFWNVGFYVHILLGGLALLIGWVQFNSKMRSRNLKLHKVIGKIYVISVLLSATAGFYIALFATGGLMASLGFICLAVIWFYTTLKAYLNIRNKQVKQHQKMMIYSYAACFAAVTLRIWLPLLTAVLGDFVTAYIIVAWLCWIPNLIVASQIVRRILD